MYENITYETILKRMLDRVPSGTDKREGSIIYDALASAAVELQLMYIEFDTILNETFGDTASREYLIRRAAERGIVPYAASNAVLKAVATPKNIDIPIGSRFSLNELNYVITEKIADGEYFVQCETEGVIGNSYFDDLIPIDYIHGLETIKITELMFPGEDEEETENLRQRYFDSLVSKSFGGNRKDYIEKTNSIDGVGGTKVTPVWNGAGTVLLTILNSEFDKASLELIEYVQNEIDPKQDGQGDGIAPIGHVVTVKTAENVEINISTNITFKDGYSFADKKTAIEDEIKAYLLEIRKNWANDDASTILISQINRRILNVPMVVDVSDTEINGGTDNMVLGEYQVPVLGGVTNA